MMGTLLTHAVAREAGKPPFFFSRFNFDRMRDRGNTHYCFHCGGECGFKPGPADKPLDSSYRKYDPMAKHDASHNDAVIANADKYTNPWDWLRHEVPANFPYVVHIPSID